MADKVIIYIKQTDEPRIPVTARIEWLPDGKIKPIMYWTPDGSCHQVSRVCETTLCAFLKNRGEGIRFKVETEIIETADLDESLLHNTYETYLYFADNWFCGKNFIDGRYDHEGKEYIPVTLDIFPDGGYELLYFWVHRERYLVEKTIEIEPHGSFIAGGIGVRHKVEARQVNAEDDEDTDPDISVRRTAALYFEVNKWFMPVKALNNDNVIYPIGYFNEPVS